MTRMRFRCSSRRRRSGSSRTPSGARTRSSRTSSGSGAGSASRIPTGHLSLARDRATLGIGAGQMSRVDSVRLAIEKAKEARGPDAETLLAGAVIASDAFFPFADGPQAAIEAGATAVIQPGGSKRDAEVIEACDAAGVAMVFTKRRHFRH